jgi:outer membrane biosynthesis protein TonB
VYYVNLFYKFFIPAVLGPMAILVVMDFGRMLINRFKKPKRAPVLEPAAEEKKEDADAVEPTVGEAEVMESPAPPVETQVPPEQPETPNKEPEQPEQAKPVESESASAESEPPAESKSSDAEEKSND